MNPADLIPGEFVKLRSAWTSFLTHSEDVSFSFVRFRGLFGDDAVVENANGKASIVEVSNLYPLDAQVPSS